MAHNLWDKIARPRKNHFRVFYPLETSIYAESFSSVELYIRPQPILYKNN